MKLRSYFLSLLFLFLFGINFANGQSLIYYHNFDVNPSGTNLYQVAPVTIDNHLSNSKWTVSSGGWTSYGGNGGGRALAVDGSQTDNTLDLSFDVTAQYAFTINGFSFLQRSSNTGYSQWTLVINNATVASGPIFVDVSGGSAPMQPTGTITLSSPIEGLTGTVHVALVLSGGGGSRSTFRFDEFKLLGTFYSAPGAGTGGGNGSSTVAAGVPINGVFDVSGIGGSSYQVPVKVAPGFNGMQPNLSLNYNSQAANNIMGMGWSVSGASVITRASNNVYNDQKTAGVVLNAGDKFALDGNRLILMSGSAYGVPSSQYHTEQESFKTITANGTLGNGPASFTVTDANGWTYQYGSTSNSLVQVPGITTPYAWLLDKVTDLSGNYMAFEYSQIGGGEVLLNQIKYQANTNTGLAPQGYVKFDYATRNDPQAIGIGGGFIKCTRKLIAITNYQQSGSVGRIVHKYTMAYADDFYTHLTSITEGGKDNTLLSGPTTFLYGGTNSFNDVTRNELTQSQLFQVFAPGDYNGDGKTDFIQFSTQNNDDAFTLFLNQGGTTPFLTSQTGSLLHNEMSDNKNYLPVVFGGPFDYDGDGKDDFFYQQVEGTTTSGMLPKQKPWIYLSSGTGISPLPEIMPTVTTNYYPSTIFAGITPLTGDFDGDGKAEILEIATTQNRSSLPYSYLIGKEYVTQGQSYGWNSHNTTSYTALQPYAFNPNGANPLPFNSDNDALFYPIDYNGDGKTEVMRVEGITTTIWEMNVTFDANNHPVIGSPTFIQVASTGYPTSYHEILTGDFNGDRVTDILTYAGAPVNWEVAYGTGDGHFNAFPAPNPNMAAPRGTAYNALRPLIIKDFNGDGKDDIYDASPTIDWGQSYPPRIYYSKGFNSFAQETPPVNTSVASMYGEKYWTGDFDGDGAEDMLVRQDGSIAPPHLFFFHPNETRHLLSQVTDGLGATTKVSYAPLTNSSVYNAGTSAYSYPFNKRIFAIKVVANVNADNGVNTAGNNTTYTYTGLKSHLLGKGLMGFDKMEQNDIATGTVSSQNFSLNTTYVFPSLQSQQVTQGGSLVRESNYTNGFYHYGNHRLFTYPVQTTEADYVTGSVTTTTNAYSFSSSGGQPASIDIGKPVIITVNKGNGLEISTQTFTFPAMTGALYQYANPQRVTATVTRQGQAPYSRTTDFSYNATTGKVTSTTTDPGTAQAVTTTLSYNSYAAVTNSTTTAAGLPSISTVTEYDATNRFATKSYNAAYPAVHTLSTYDPVAGTVSKTVSSDGFTITNTYDGFGRPNISFDNNGAATNTVYKPATSFSGIAPSNAVFGVQVNTNATAPSYKFYDRLGRLVRKAYPSHAMFGPLTYEDISYNILGQTATKTKPYFANAAPQNITYAYDTKGRSIAVNAPEGATTVSYALAGGLYSITTTNPAGQAKKISSDASDKIVAVADDGGTLNYTFHSNGQPSQVTLDGAMVAQTAYDPYGRVSSRIDPNYGGSGAFQYTYDAYDRVTSKQDPHGNTYTYNYDGLGNILSKTGPDGVYGYTYTYTAGANCSKQTLVTAPNGVVQQYDYGMGGKINFQKLNANGVQLNTFYSYDAFGRVSGMTYPNGKQVQYAYSPNNGGKMMVESGPNDLNYRMYYYCPDKNASGQVTEELQGSIDAGNSFAVSTTYTYDSDHFLSDQNSTSTVSGAQLKHFQYSFDPTTGNLTTRKDVGNSIWEDFTYDDLNRLTHTQTYSGTPPFWVTYLGSLAINYSNNGNISEKTDAGTFGYDQANRVSSIFPYVNVPDNQQDITYTPFDKVASITEGDTSVQFTYWADGSRSSMATYENGVLKRTKYYTPGFEREVDAATGQVRDLCYIDGERGNIAAILETKAGVDKNYYAVSDYLGSLLQLADENGNVVTERSFDAWGRNRNPQGWAALSPVRTSDGWDRGYTGHEHIPEFGIINMNGRLYDPLMGRMVSPDPYIMGNDNTQGYNRYSYALNNPLKYTDPTGKWVHIVIGAIVGGVINLGVKAMQGKINSVGDGLVAFGIGAVGGAIGAATGGAVFVAAGGAAGGAGGFIAGAASGAAGAAVSAPVVSMGNAAYFKDPLITPKQWLMGIAIGAAAGGIFNGVAALANGRNFFTGTLPQSSVAPIQPVPIRELQQVGGDGVKQIELPENPQQQLTQEFGTVKSINYEKVYGKLLNHAFSQDHINDGVLTIASGSRMGTMDAAVKVIELNQNLLVNGSNEIIVNGGQYTVRCFVQNGEVINANIFSGVSGRSIGNLINCTIR